MLCSSIISFVLRFNWMMKQLTEKTEKTEKTENGRKKAAENNPLRISAAEKCMNQERNCKTAPRKKDILSRLFHDNVPVIKFSVSWSLPRSQSSEFSFLVCRIFMIKQTSIAVYNAFFILSSGLFRFNRMRTMSAMRTVLWFSRINYWQEAWKTVIM